MTWLRRRARVLSRLFVLALIVAGCGVPLDDEAEVIASEQLPEVLQPGSSNTTPTTIPDRLAEEVVIYLVDPGDGEPSLEPVSRQVASVEANDGLEASVLDLLILGPTSEEQLDLNLTTAVVSSEDVPLEVIAVELPAEQQLVVTLSAPPAIEGSDRLVTFAQLVFTLTELDTVSQVSFLVRNEAGEDEEIAVRTDTEEGDVRRPVNRNDYLSLFPN